MPESVKRYYLERTVADTVVTTRIDGVPHRVLRTEFVDELEQANSVTLAARARSATRSRSRRCRARRGAGCCARASR